MGMNESIIAAWDCGEYTAVDIAEHFEVTLSYVIDILYHRYPELRGVFHNDQD